MNGSEQTLSLKHWLTKWTVWEYFPWWLANIPVYGFFAWFALRARHLFFFTNVNPAIPLGGAMGESKNGIYKLLPPEILPPTLFVPAGQTMEQVMTDIARVGMGFPLIAKPDIGERGFLVKKIESQEALVLHLQQFNIDFILQAFLYEPMEMTVLFHRFPEDETGKPGKFGITSVCIKEFLRVRGDGARSIRQLMQDDARAAFQIPRFEQENPALLATVPAAGALLLLEPIGNHVRGTKFLNGNQFIDTQLIETFEPICKRIEGVLYGRFDLKCASVEALRQGEFKVMELNGVLGEPAHVYDPTYGMWRAYRDLYRHWRILYALHRAQARKGIPPTPYREAWAMTRQYFRYKKQLEKPG
jgi:hypothetical protein